jgi:sugar phosphate isomerase/epimerase
MNLGISHLAFRDNIEVQQFAPHIKSLGINSLELVFAKGLDIIFDCGLNIKSTQSLLHQSNVNDFLDENMFDTIVDISNKCSMCNINLMVLGSPKQRRILDYERLLGQFTKIDNLLRGRNQILCIEPNAKEYGGKYFYTISEIVNFLDVGRFSNIKTMIDTHNLILEGDNILSTFEKHYEYIEHIHISEYKLSTFIPSDLHLEFSYLIKQMQYDKTITNEVLIPTDLLNNIKQFTEIYGN